MFKEIGKVIHFQDGYKCNVVLSCVNWIDSFDANLCHGWIVDNIRYSMLKIIQISPNTYVGF